MTRSGKKRILVTLDGSQASLDTIGYLAHVLSGTDIDLTLYSVMTGVPESFWDIEQAPDQSVSAVWKADRQKDLEAFMEQSRRILIDGGIAEGNINVTIRARETGVARDILHESQQGYDAVVAGRVGMNPFTRLVVGSVANKLIDSMGHLPIWVVSRSVRSKKFLLALDASPGAMRCVSFAGWMLAGTDAHFTLYHIMRDYDFKLTGTGLPASDYPEASQWYRKGEAELEKAKHAMHAVMQRAVGELEKAGIASDRITTKIMTGMASRAGAIMAQAILGGYCTIIIGRRGLSQVSEFSMGRVCNKVIQLSNELTVWVVN
jgi:nucleotide-binding universal stress UspA family protein